MSINCAVSINVMLWCYFHVAVSKQLAEKLASSGDEIAYKPPDGLQLKSAGAHNKRSKEHSKDGDYDLAIADLIRALMRQGLEEDVKSKMERALADAFRGLSGQRKQEGKEKQAARKVCPYDIYCSFLSQRIE